MNIIEYLCKDYKECYEIDEFGNCYVDLKLYKKNWYEIGYFMVQIDDDTLFISKEDIPDIEILLDEDVEFPGVRGPYYRMRGRPVTREQAFEIIRRNDNFFYKIDKIWKSEEFFHSINFVNQLINSRHSPYGYGWIHVDGTVGCNGIIGKYPTLDEILHEWTVLLSQFPELDLIIALTNLNEGPDLIEYETGCDISGIFWHEDYDDMFYRYVECGIYVHDKKIQILDSKHTIKKYKEYASLYETNRRKYEPDYYEKNSIQQVDMEYLKKCVRAYGIEMSEDELYKKWAKR